MEEYWILEDEADEEFQEWKALYKKTQEELWDKRFHEFRTEATRQKKNYQNQYLNEPPLKLYFRVICYICIYWLFLLGR